MVSTKIPLFKLLTPVIILLVFLILPVPTGMPPQTWHFLGVFISMVVGMIMEPIPATAISFIAVTICVIFGNYFLFSSQELSNPDFKPISESLKWGLAGFSNPTVWLVFGAFIFALGYDISGLGRRIALILVKYMGKRTLTLGYSIVIIDVLLAPFTPSNTARTGGTVFPVVKNLPSLFKSYPNDPSSKKIGGYLMWMMVISTSLSSSMFVTGSAPNVLGVELVHKIAGIKISWLMWFMSFLPVGIILLIVAPWLSYVLYKPEITHSEEVSQWAKNELKAIGKLQYKEVLLIILVLLSLILWMFGGQFIDTTSVALLAVSLMLLLGVLSWKDITNYKSAWNTFVNLATLVVMANGLKRSGFIDWFSTTMSHYLTGFSPIATVAILVLVFYFAHYFFASLSAHTATLLPVMLAIGSKIPGIPMDQLSILLVLSIGIMGCQTPYATGASIIIYGSCYIKSKDYWRLGFIFGIIFITLLLCVGWPLLILWL